MYLTVFFTESSIPKTGLSPTVKIRDVSDNSVVVNGGALTEVGDGWYKYDFTTFDDTKNYTILFDGGAALPNSERYAASGSTGLTQSNVASAVWDEDLSTHDTLGTAGSYLSIIKQIETGRWKIENSVMILYSEDGTTPLYRFRLYDRDHNSVSAESGAPAERVPY
jgi:hypothetical protein